MLKPLAYAVWLDEELRNQIFRILHVQTAVSDIATFCDWLVERDGHKDGLINLERIPITIQGLYY